MGTYTSGASEGIYVFEFNAATGQFQAVDTARGISNPSYLVTGNNGRNLYAVNENKGNAAAISAFSVEPRTGKFQFINKKTSLGDAPCYVTVSEKNKWVIAANYSGGSLTAYKLAPDGGLSDTYQTIQHTGKGVDTSRQLTPHVHSTIFDPNEAFLLVADLGLDKIYSYQFRESAKTNPLKPASPPFAAVTPGSGPRHLVFHPNQKWFYLIEEMSGFVSSWTYQKGSMSSTGRVDAHAPGYTGRRGSADIHISPDGRFVYASNRFEANDIAIFSVDPANGMLTNISNQPLTTKNPRNFIISPDGNWLLAAGQNDTFIEVLKRNQHTGLLTATDIRIPVPNAVCIQLFRL
ncbi:MAG: lactonase family protein [Flavihumibacter sp.]